MPTRINYQYDKLVRQDIDLSTVTPTSAFTSTSNSTFKNTCAIHLAFTSTTPHLNKLARI